MPQPDRTNPSDASPAHGPRRGLLGWRAAAFAFGFAGLVAVILVLGLHSFLAVTSPIQSRTLVVEGWLPDHGLEEAIAEFHRGGYEHLYTTGGPHERGSLLIAHRSFAESAAQTLVRLGLSSNLVTAVPSQVRHRNRTLGAALALRDYCRDHGIQLESINLVTEGAHARRSWICFRRALDGSCQVGIIALVDRSYDADRWWRFSEGVKTMLGETIGLLYAWLALDFGT